MLDHYQGGDNVAIPLPGIGGRKKRNGLGYSIGGQQPGQMDTQVLQGAKSQFATIPEQPTGGNFDTPSLPTPPTSGGMAPPDPASGGVEQGLQNLNLPPEMTGGGLDGLLNYWRNQGGGASGLTNFYNSGRWKTEDQYGHPSDAFAKQMYDYLMGQLGGG